MDSNTRLSCARQEDGCHHGYMAGKEFHKSSHVAPNNNHVSLTCMTFATVLCVLICVVSLSAVFVLAIKVQMLEAKMNELFKQNEMIYALNEEILENNPTMVDSTPRPVIETPKQIHRKNLTTESLHGAPKISLRNDSTRHANRRVTRQVSGGSNRCCSQNTRCCSENTNQHTFAHLSGNAGSVCGHRWLSWYRSSDENYGGLSVQLMVVVQNTFIRIHRPGYYYVYGQLTYHRRLDDLPSTPVGYSMVRISTCGATTETTLLETKTTQTWLDNNTGYTGAGRSIDSSHIGGVFYFNYLDEIGIRTQRTDNPDPTPRVLSPNAPTDTYNYFGAILLIPYSAGIRTCDTVVRSHAEGCGAPGL